MLRFTNITPIYNNTDGTIKEYQIQLDNNFTDGNSVSATLTIKSDELDMSSVIEICKKKLQETVAEN
ncbi:MAG: hypothetical protein LKF42_00350 [Streptococcaceae bacterium]|jgi:hypothetical protein|nr:hypothetical protein [Streptococcaceae bacterium]MCH4176182.1 hypothetical protein [Streptococcaceae bacterium]